MFPANHVVMPMAFDVGLVHNIKTHLIREVVQIGIVRIMCRPDGVEVVSFHECQIPVDFLLRDGFASSFAMVVAVDSEYLLMK